MSLVRIICSNTDAPPVAVSGVLVKIYNQAGDTFVTDATSDASGYAEYDLPNATYQVRASKTGCSISATTYITVVTPPNPGVYNEFDLEVEERSLGAPSASYLCRIGGYLLDASGRPQADSIIRLMLKEPHRVDSNYAVDENVRYETDENGWVVFELIRGAFYEVQIGGAVLETFEIEVPDADETDLGHFLHPVPAQATWTPVGPLALVVGTLEEVDVDVTMDSKVVYAAGSEEIDDLVEFTTSDSAVIHVSGSCGNLTITPIAAGSANVVMALRASYAEVTPTPSLSGATLAVTVT